MKSYLICCISSVLLTALAISARAQTIYPEVNGDTLILWETQADRNCGAMYVMGITEFDHTINWYQIDTGATALCMCVFDLSVKYGPLQPGDYTANVYYTDAWIPEDTLFEGSTSFTISSSGRDMSSGVIISQYQSDCYSGQGLDKEGDEQALAIYPVPLRSGEILHFEVFSEEKNALLEILTVSGKLLYKKEYISNNFIRDNWKREELFPSAGIYVFRLTIADKIYIRKIPVL